MAVYTKHSKQAKGIIYNENTRCFTTWNDKGMHVWHPDTAEQLFYYAFHDDAENPCQVSCLCYSKKYHLYFLCTKDFKLVVLNEYLNKVTQMPMGIRLVKHCIFIDETQ